MMTEGVNVFEIMTTGMGRVPLEFPDKLRCDEHFSIAVHKLMTQSGARPDLRSGNLIQHMFIVRLHRTSKRALPLLLAERPRRGSSQLIAYMGVRAVDNLIEDTELLSSVVHEYEPSAELSLVCLPVWDVEDKIDSRALRAEVLKHYMTRMSYSRAVPKTPSSPANLIPESYQRQLDPLVASYVSGFSCVLESSKAGDPIVTVFIWHEDPDTHARLDETAAPRVREALRDILPAGVESRVVVTLDKVRGVIGHENSDTLLSRRIADKLKTMYE